MLTCRHFCCRYVNLSNATPDQLEELTRACEPASFGVKQENELDETYRKAGKMDSECFASMLDPSNTDLLNIVRGYLLDGPQSNRGVIAELYKLNIYGKYFNLSHPPSGAILPPRQRLILQAPCRYTTERKHVRVACGRLSDTP